MTQNLFTPNTIAVIWDFDKTLSPSYMSYSDQKGLANEIASQGVLEYVVRRKILFMHRAQTITIQTGAKS